MKINWRAWVVILALLAGWIVLVGYYVDFAPLQTVREWLLRSMLILGAFALWVGVLNLAGVHWRKLTANGSNRFFSLALLIALAATLVAAAALGPTAAPSRWIFNYIQFPIEASLMAILAVTLIVSAARMLRRRTDVFSLVFLLVAALCLVGLSTLPVIDVPALKTFRTWILDVPAAGGARGLLLGVALGAAAAGLRILMGADRPYEG